VSAGTAPEGCDSAATSTPLGRLSPPALSMRFRHLAAPHEARAS
jgi:hypothetical protein